MSDLNDFLGQTSGMIVITLVVIAIVVALIAWLRGRGSSDLAKLIKESEAGGEVTDSPKSDQDDDLPPEDDEPAKKKRTKK